MTESSYEYKEGQYLSFKAEGQQRFTRLRSLGEGYSEDELRAEILGNTIHVPHAKKSYKKYHDKISLIIDIQTKLSEGKGIGYERWAKVFNLKQMANTLNFLQENDIHDYEALVEKAKEAYTAYRKSGYSVKIYEENTEAILLHQATKKAFDNLESAKIPPVKILQEEFADCKNRQKL